MITHTKIRREDIWRKVVAIGARTSPTRTMLAISAVLRTDYYCTVPVAACTTSRSANVCVNFANLPTPPYTFPKPTNGISSRTRPSTTVHKIADTKLYRMRYCLRGELDCSGFGPGFFGSMGDIGSADMISMPSRWFWTVEGRIWAMTSTIETTNIPMYFVELR